MTVAGQFLAKPPASPHANLTATMRVGKTVSGSVIWQLTCTCGAHIVGVAPAIKSGKTKCKQCNATEAGRRAALIVAAMPGTYARLERKTKLTRANVEYHVGRMHKDGRAHIGDWERSEFQGAFSPVFFAGSGEDVPCTLKPRPLNETKRRWTARIRKAIQRAEAGAKFDDRYARYVGIHEASKTAAGTRAAPNSWFGALPGAREAIHG